MLSVSLEKYVVCFSGEICCLFLWRNMSFVSLEKYVRLFLWRNMFVCFSVEICYLFLWRNMFVCFCGEICCLFLWRNMFVCFSVEKSVHLSSCVFCVQRVKEKTVSLWSFINSQVGHVCLRSEQDLNLGLLNASQMQLELCRWNGCHRHSLSLYS